MGTRRPDGRTTDESSEFRLETLEPRLLFSADLPFAALGPLADGAFAPAVAPLDTAAGLARDVTEGADGVAAAASSPNELVIVYADVPDLERLLADLAREGGAARDIVVLAASDSDGTSADAALARLGAVLDGRENLTAVHLISHGADGALALGGVTVDTLDLLANAGAVAGWGDAFADGADLLLYGCDIAASADGRAFVDTLAALSGADVAASDDVTGAAAAGGDWRLEYARGSVSHDIATGVALRDDFAGTLATTHTVSSLADVPPGDPGYAGTLRWALEQANDGDDIAFGVAGTIALQSALPPVAVTVTIDATTLPGYAGSPLVVLDGTAAGTDADGLFFEVGSDASTLRGLAIVNFGGHGLVLETANNHVVQANHIGTDGTRAMGNGSDGIHVILSSGNLLGGPDRSDGNVVSGNGGNGIVLTDRFSSFNEIQNNLIGTDAAGELDFGNGGTGIALYNGSHDNRIGGTAGFGNVVSGNSGDGILISAPGADGNVIGDNLVGLAADGTTALGNARHGIVLYQGPQGNLIGTDGIDGAPNVVSSNGADGIVIDGAGGTDTKDNLVAGNLVGTDAGGTLARGNGTSGIALFGGARENTIGGTGVRANVISANGHGGVYIGDAGTDGNRIVGNRIGTDIHGTADLGNTFSGIGIVGDASGNVIGGDASAGMGNLISGNGAHGVEVAGGGTAANTVAGNRIGLDAIGTGRLGNGGDGVHVDLATGTRVGGAANGAGNVISANGGHGITIAGALDTRVDGNVVGTSADGAIDLGNGGNGVTISDGATSTRVGDDVSDTAAGTANVISANVGAGIAVLGAATVDNAFLGNVLERNGGLGIDLNGDGVDAVGEPDADPGANSGIGRPTITRVGTDENGRVEIRGEIETTPDTLVRVDVYATGSPDPSGHGGAQRHLGSVAATTDENGRAGGLLVVNALLLEGESVTATLTRSNADGTPAETSEFAANVVARELNVEPVVTSDAFDAPENVALVGTVEASDANGDAPVFSIVGGADAARFTIDAASGALAFIDAPDAEAPSDANGDGVHALRVSVSDGYLSSERDVTVRVTDVDETDVGVPIDVDSTVDGVAENAAFGSAVGVTASASDADVTDAVSYALTDDAGGRFAIDTASGVVTVAAGLDHETASSHAITIEARSTDGSSATRDIVIAVGDVNEFSVDAVADMDATADAIEEDAMIGTAVGVTARATDGDGTDAVSYALTDDAGGRFAIDATSGVVTVAAELDHEATSSHAITIEARSTDGSSATRDIVIAVGDVNEFSVDAVADMDATADAVEEDAMIGTAVGVTARATDGDGTDAVSYALTDDAGGRFAIDATSGVVTVAAELDHEATSSHAITIEARSTDGSSTTRDIVIAVGDVNEFSVDAVVDMDATVDAVEEDAMIGTAVGVTARATDGDGTDAVSYAL